MKSIIFLSLFFTSVYAYALPPMDPYDACASISMSTYRDQCARTVSKSEWFDPYAASACSTISMSARAAECMDYAADKFYDHGVPAVCASISMSSYAVQCIRDSANKRYDEGALRICSSHTMSSRIHQCMAEMGGPYQPPRDPRRDPDCLSNREVARYANRAKEAIRSRNDREALRVLDDLIYTARRCDRYPRAY